MPGSVPVNPPLPFGQRQIFEDLSKVHDFNLGKVQATMVRLGIGPEEVLSAIASPDEVEFANDKHDTRMYFRGDIRAWVDMSERDVLEVADVFHKERREPRVALYRDIEPPTTPKRQARGKKKDVPERQPSLDLAESEEVNWLFREHAEPDVRFITITPVMAQALLDRNVGYNRPRRSKDTDDWADQMIDGRWKITHQGVALDRSGKLIDGQHRLEAITLAEIAARMVVCVGLEPEVYAVIDTGRKRSLSDSLASAGYYNVFILSAAVRAIYQMQHGLMDTPANRKRKLHNDALLDFFLANEAEVLEALKAGGTLARAIHTRAPAMAAFVWAVNKHPRAQEFMDTLASGENLSAHDPRFVYRRLAFNSVGNPTFRSHVMLATLLKAWAAYLYRRPVRLITYKMGEEFPAVAGFDDKGKPFDPMTDDDGDPDGKALAA